MYCLKVPFLRTVKYNNFVPCELSVYNCSPENNWCYPEKKSFALKRKSVAPKRENSVIHVNNQNVTESNRGDINFKLFQDDIS